MRKAKKNLHRMPKLSFLDQVIYWAGLLLLGICWFALAFSPLLLRDWIAFSEEAVVAAREHASSLWILVPWMTFFLMTFIAWTIPYQNRQPIFGLKNFKYGPPAWPKVYPLFMKDKPYVWVSQREQKRKKQLKAVLLMILLVSFIPFPWSLYGRDCLYRDGSIRQYSMFNNLKKEYLCQEIETVEFSTYRYSTGKYVKTTHWGVEVTLTTNSGNSYSFQDRDTKLKWESGSPQWLGTMLDLKEQYDPAIIRYDPSADLDRVVWDCGLSDADEARLYQLFGAEYTE